MTEDAPADAPGPGGLTHLDAAGRARMVDVGAKEVTAREAVARGRVVMSSATLARITDGLIPKGDVFAVARVAAIMAAKRTHELIPLCHPLALSAVEVSLTPVPALPGGAAGATADAAVEIEATVRTTGRTGVEMEALTAATVAGLTVYDMCKAVERGMRLEAVRLVSKRGGKSGDYRAD